MSSCSLALRVAMEVIKENCEDRFYEVLADLLGVSGEVDPSKAREVVESFSEEVCKDFEKQKEWVYYRTVLALKTGNLSKWKDYLDRAWRDLRKRCRERGVVV